MGIRTRTWLESGIIDPDQVVRNGMSAANIRAIYENASEVWWPEQVTLTGNQTIDLSGLRSKSSFSLVSGKPILITDASTALIVGGQDGGGGDFGSNTYAPQFFGDWFILQSGARVHGTRGVFVNAQTYRLHFDRLWIKNFGGGLQGTQGEIRTVTIDRWACWDFVAFGWEMFSKDHLKEISEIFITGQGEGNTSEAGAEGLHFSFGPGMGSAGKEGWVVRNGVYYRQAWLSEEWPNREVESFSWAAGVLTITLTRYHSLAEGDDVWLGGSDNANLINLTPTPWTALEDTDGKVIKIAMASDPGAYTVPGFMTYDYRSVPAGFNDYERPRKGSFYEVSGRGQRDGGHNIISSVIKFRGDVVDDAGTSDPYALWCEGTWDAGGGGIVTYKTYETVIVDGVPTRGDPSPHMLSPGDRFNTRLMQPSGYSASLVAATTPDSNTVTATMVDNPGAAASTRQGDYYKPTNLNAPGWRYGERAGPPDIEACEAHENYGPAVEDNRITNERGWIVNNRFYNQRYGFPDATDPDKMGDLWFRPGRANMTVTDNKLGAGDTWRFASKSFVFSGNPTAGDYISLALTTTAEPTFFIFDTVSDPDASQPSVLIGATVPETIANLRDAIHAQDDANCRAVQASARDANLSELGTIDRLLLVRTVPGAVGKEYQVTESSSVISLSPSGASLAGGTGTATANYGIMGIRDGDRGNIVQRNQMESHTDGESDMDPIAEPVIIQPNFLDNADFSLDQQNEGAAATLTSASVTVRIVDRWSGTRSTANVTAQRVAGTVFPYGLQVIGGASNTAVVIGQRIEGSRAAALEGEVLVFSGWVHSPDLVKCALRLATADVLDTFSAVTTVKLKQFVIGPDPVRISFVTLGTAAVANGIEVSFRFTDGVTAGQTVTIEGAKLEISGVITDFIAPEPDNNLFACQRYLRKSFPLGTAPAQNAGTTGAIFGVQSIAGANAQTFETVAFSPPMRIAPTVTLYNPSATNAQIRNTAAAADWSASTAGSITANGMTISGTGAGGGTAGQASAVHYSADAGL